MRLPEPDQVADLPHQQAPLVSGYAEVWEGLHHALPSRHGVAAQGLHQVPSDRLGHREFASWGGPSVLPGAGTLLLPRRGALLGVSNIPDFADGRQPCIAIMESHLCLLPGLDVET